MNRQGLAVCLERRFLLFLLLTALAALAACAFIYGKKLNYPPIRSDGFGYYAYFPAAVIERDLSFERLAAERFNGEIPGWTGINRHPGTGLWADKYPPGVAILGSPLYLLADIWVRLKGGERSGFELPYQLASIASAIVYLCLGLSFLYAGLRTRFAEGVSLSALAAILFGTSTFHYASYDGCFSHIYSFAMASFLLYASLAYVKPRQPLQAFRLGLALGLVVMLRLVNATFGLLALLAFYKAWRSGEPLRRLAGHALLCTAAFSLCLVPVALYQYYSAGTLFCSPYLNETFNWSDPQFANFLWSVRKGVFFWSPLSLIGVVGLAFLWSGDRSLSAVLGLILALQVYLCASWAIWSFGGSFGSRVFVDVSPFLALPLAALLEAARKSRLSGRALNLTLVFCCAYTSLMMLAYWRNFIPFDETTWNQWLRAFGRILSL